MACDLEWALLHIMVHCAPNPLEQLRRFKGMMMHEKIQNTICDLKTYKPDLYAEYAEELEKLWEFKILRNDMSHHIIEMAPDFQSFRFIYVDIHEEKEVLFEKKYTLEQILEVHDVFRKLTLTIGELFLKMEGKGMPSAS
jgi:hypothetical protein